MIRFLLNSEHEIEGSEGTSAGTNNGHSVTESPSSTCMSNVMEASMRQDSGKQLFQVFWILQTAHPSTPNVFSVLANGTF